MQNLTNKIASIASIIGVIGVIGAFYYKAGQYNLRLDQIENKEFIVNETVDLSGINAKISSLETQLGIMGAKTDYLEAKIEELETKFGNPLLN
jgi:peptidoglycan hydrolase CwlO-like protein